MIQLGHNQMGRWVWQRLMGQGPRALFVITAYQVCSNSVGNAVETPQAATGDQPNLRSTMLVDLMEFVNKQLEDEQEILLMWDANMVPLEQDMKTFVDTMGLQVLINYF